MMNRQRVAAFAAVTLLSACSGGSNLNPATSAGSSVPSINGKATAKTKFTVKWPGAGAAGHRIQPKYISPAAKSIVIGGAGNNQTINAPNTTITFDAPVGTDTFTFTSYDQPDGNGNVLSQANVTQQILANTTNTLNVTLDGVCANWQLTPAASAQYLQTSYSPDNIHYQPLLTFVANTPQVINVAPVDADGYTIVGPGAVPLPATATVGYNPGSGGVATASLSGNQVTLQGGEPVGYQFVASLQVSGPACSSTTATVAVSFALEPLGTASGITASALSTPNDVTSSNGGYFSIGYPPSYLYGWVVNSGSATVSYYEAASSPTWTLGFSNPTSAQYYNFNNVLYVADAGTNSLYAVSDPTYPSGYQTVTTVATGLSNPQGMSIDGAGNIYIADSGSNSIKRLAPEGALTTIASGFNAPSGVAVDDAGTIYVADTGNGAVKEITPNGTVTTLATGFTSPVSLVVSRAGTVYVADKGAGVLDKVTRNGAVSTLVSGFSAPSSVAYADFAYNFNYQEGSIPLQLFVTDSAKNTLTYIQ